MLAMRIVRVWLILAALLPLGPFSSGEAFAAQPATRPVETGECWLGRARAEIVAMRKAPDTQPVYTHVDLTVVLGHVERSAANDALIRDVLKTLEQSLPANIKADHIPYALAVGRGRLHRALGEDEDARRHLVEARGQIPKMTPPPMIFTTGIYGTMLGTIAAEWGEYDLAVELLKEYPLLGDPAPYQVYLDVGKLAGAAGRKQASDKAFAEARRLVLAAEKREWALRALAQAQAEARRFAESLATAGQIKPGWEARETFRDIVRHAGFARDQQTVRSALVAALKLEEHVAGSPSELASVAYDAADAGLREVFVEAAAATEDALRRAPDDTWRCAPRLARGYFAVARDRDAGMRMLQAAEKATAKLKPGGDRDEAMMDLAATYARLGEHERVSRLLEPIPRIAMAISETFWWIPRTYAAMDDFERALEITEKHLDREDRGGIYVELAKEACRAGRFSVAVDIAGRIHREHVRVQTWALIAQRQAAQGPSDGLVAWIDRLPTPRVRAVVNLAVGQQVLGVRLPMTLRLVRRD
jgi:tetratricopeptide (TPR) repeat protein